MLVIGAPTGISHVKVGFKTYPQAGLYTNPGEDRSNVSGEFAKIKYSGFIEVAVGVMLVILGAVGGSRSVITHTLRSIVTVSNTMGASSNVVL